MKNKSEFVYISVNEDSDKPYTVTMLTEEVITTFVENSINIASFETEEEASDLVKKIKEEKNNG